jgi:GMP synthase (glutamine-hydrolysing)
MGTYQPVNCEFHDVIEARATLRKSVIRQGWQVRNCEVGVDDLSTPEIQDADLLVMLGGPISAEDDAMYPCLAS